MDTIFTVAALGLLAIMILGCSYLLVKIMTAPEPKSPKAKNPKRRGGWQVRIKRGVKSLKNQGQ